jgi:hypothetical protein
VEEDVCHGVVQACFLIPRPLENYLPNLSCKSGAAQRGEDRKVAVSLFLNQVSFSRGLVTIKNNIFNENLIFF